MQLPKLHGGNPSVRRADQAERMQPLSPQGGIAASCLVDNEKPRFFLDSTPNFVRKASAMGGLTQRAKHSSRSIAAGRGGITAAGL